MKVRNEVFSWDFIERNSIPGCYSKLYLKESNYSFANPKMDLSAPYPVVCVAMFPKYLDAGLTNEKDYKVKKITQKGYPSALVNIASHDFNSYKEYLGKSILSSINRRIKKLEKNFNIGYRMYYGKISQTEYDLLMQALIEMKNKRLDELNMENKVLSDYQNHKRRAFDLINQKQASLYVIYSDDKPIGISFNFHVDKLFFGTMTTFDMDFSEYGIGNTLLFKQMEWCFENKIAAVDMGIGSLDYKCRWANTVYNYEYHVIYRKKSLKSFIRAQVEIIKIHLKNSVKQLKSGFKKDDNLISPKKLNSYSVENKFI
ncbi:MAG: GNAT family N-acetyltransferase [Mangrovimonas sp.]|nr:GNAT family N-acetyltransferase [Mangrovimonas sp.]MCB0438923.1 GNAT family N-acetyltransferase [Mangrovimonas sp.]